MANLNQDNETIEAPQASEVFERLPEPKSSGKIGLPSDKVKLWQQRVAVARKIRDHKLKYLHILIDFYEGFHWHDTNDIPVLSDKSTVNLIFAHIKNEIPHLYFQNPTPIVTAKRGEFELNAFAMQELIKYYSKFNLGTALKRHVRLCILDAKFSYGVLKVSYTPMFSPNPDKDQPEVAGKDDFGVPIFVTDESGNIVTQSDQILVSELYNIERISPKEILVDSECGNFPERAKWIGQEIVKSVEYIKNSKLYKNKDYLKKNVEIDALFKARNKAEEEITASRELIGKDIEKVRFVEIYDYENGELLVLPDDYDDFIREEQVYMSPYSFLKFNEKPDDFYPVSDIRQGVPINQEINVGNSMMITHARRSARKYYYSQDTFGQDEDEEMEKAKNPDDMGFFKIKDYDKPPMPLQMAVQDPSIFQTLIQSKTNFNEVMSSTEAERGESVRRKTGKEAAFQEGHGAVRRSDKQNLVADFIVDTFINLGSLMQATLTVPQAIKVIGSAGMFWTQVEKKDIQGQFFYDINVDELKPQIPELMRQDLVEYISALSQFINILASNPILMQIFNVQGMVKEFSKTYPNLNINNILNMKVTPEQISQMVMMQMQNQNTGAGNQNASI